MLNARALLWGDRGRLAVGLSVTPIPRYVASYDMNTERYGRGEANGEKYN